MNDAETKNHLSWEHDCDRCTFLARSEDGYADLYFCLQQHDQPTVVARYGDLGHQYTSGLRIASVSPWLSEAKKLAMARGLLSDPDETPPHIERAIASEGGEGG